MNEKIIYYHVYLFGNWETIVKDQLETLKNSGLLKESKLKVGLVYYAGSDHQIDHFKQILSEYENSEIIFVRHTNACGESDTLHQMHQFALSIDHNVNILYIHAKGVTQYLSEREQYVWEWRKIMEYFLVENWQDCVDKLNNGYDCCGINYQDHAAHIKGKIVSTKIFNGNFYWANSNYLKKLDNSILWEHRHSGENWILSSEHRVYLPFSPPPAFDFYNNSIQDYKK